MKEDVQDYRRLNMGKATFVIMLLLVLLLSAGLATAQSVIDVQGEFNGEMVGYSEDYDQEQSEQNRIDVSGEFTMSGEDAHNVVVTVESSEWTVVDPESVESFVESESDVSFDTEYNPGSIEFSTERIPAGSNVRLEYSAVFLGGTDESSINAGTVTVQYETEGGTRRTESFESPTSVENSPDRTIKSLSGQVGTDTLIRILAYLAVPAIIILVIIAVLKVKGGPGNGPPEPPN